MGRSNPAPSRTATPQQLAQHARRLAEAADREASRLARAAPSDMPHAQTFFRSQSLSPGDGSDYLSPPSSLPTVAPVAANAAQDVVPETQALTGGDAAAGLFAAVAPGATGGTAGDAAAGLFAAVAPGATGGTAGDAAAGLIAADAVLSMEKYISYLMNLFDVKANGTTDCPMSPSYKMEVSIKPTDTDAMRDKPFLSLLSSLFWISRCCRYDIAVALTILSTTKLLTNVFSVL
ncbi:hypothetical protein NFJ02_02g71650 [Pycnococcus provasolii]